MKPPTPQPGPAWTMNRSLDRKRPVGGWILACMLASLVSLQADKVPKREAPGVLRVGTLSKKYLTEASGVIRSRRQDNLYWTHDDGPCLVLTGIRSSGTVVSRHPLNGVFLWDWEDIADDDIGNLYVADTGNNFKARPTVTVYRFPEPDPRDDGSSLESDRRWRLRFPAEPFDSEGLFIWKECGYLISKTSKDKPAWLYRWPLKADTPTVILEEIGPLRVEDPVTGADISWNGRRLGLVTTKGALVATIPEEGPDALPGCEFFSRAFDEGQIEGCAFTPEGLLAVSESQEVFLFDEEEFRP